MLPVANPDTGWKPMLHYTVAWPLWARKTPVRKHFPRPLDTRENNVSLLFNPPLFAVQEFFFLTGFLKVLLKGKFQSFLLASQSHHATDRTRRLK
jgi:hypothetical protein